MTTNKKKKNKDYKSATMGWNAGAISWFCICNPPPPALEQRGGGLTKGALGSTPALVHLPVRLKLV